jgi:oxygen-independent coproporphyrinogen III oxidase
MFPPELLDRYDRPGPRYTSYPPIPSWTADFGEPGYREALEDLARRPEDPSRPAAGTAAATPR